MVWRLRVVNVKEFATRGRVQSGLVLCAEKDSYLCPSIRMIGDVGEEIKGFNHRGHGGSEGGAWQLQCQICLTHDTRRKAGQSYGAMSRLGGSTGAAPVGGFSGNWLMTKST